MIIFFPSPVFPLTLSSSSENEHKSDTLPYQEKKINQPQTTTAEAAAATTAKPTKP